MLVAPTLRPIVGREPARMAFAFTAIRASQIAHHGRHDLMTLAARVCYPFAASSNRHLPFAYGQELGKGSARQFSVGVLG